MFCLDSTHIPYAERRDAALDVVKERMDASLKAGGANAAMLTQLSNMFTAILRIKRDGEKAEERGDKLPFLDLVVKLQFSLDVEIWIDCFNGIEDSTATFKASACTMHSHIIYYVMFIVLELLPSSLEQSSRNQHSYSFFLNSQAQK